MPRKKKEETENEEQEEEVVEQPTEEAEEKPVRRAPVKREIVVPGEELAEKGGRKLGDGVYFEDGKIFAKILGIPIVGDNEVKVIPVSGVYMPRINDKIVGVITKVESSGWIVDVNSPYEAYLPVSDGVDEFVDIHRTDISRFFTIGDVIFCKISKVTGTGSVRVSMRSLGARKLFGGAVMKVKPTTVPRIIGRGGSMINMIKDKTGCVIYIGKNGVVWIRGDNKQKAIEAIMTIQRESHSSGLTDRIEKMLSESQGNNDNDNDKKGE